MATWPATLPQPQVGALTVSPRDRLTRFEPDIGAPIVRARTTAKHYEYSARLLLTEAERQTLDAFFQDDCAGGATSFSMNEWAAGVDCVMQWLAPPAYNHAGFHGHWYVDISLLRLP